MGQGKYQGYSIAFGSVTGWYMRKFRFGGDLLSIPSVKSESGVVQSSQNNVHGCSARRAPCRLQKSSREGLIPGDFSIWVRIVKDAGWENGIGRHQERRTWGLLPDVFEDLRDLKLIGDEGDDPHQLPHLQQVRGSVSQMFRIHFAQFEGCRAAELTGTASTTISSTRSSRFSRLHLPWWLLL